MTRIEMEREWAAQPWWHRALAVLVLQRGLAVANGVALAGVGFLAVATYHIANTFLHEEDEGQIYAALPVPALSHANNGLLRFAHGDPLLIVGNLDGTASDWDAVSDDSQGVIRASDPARGVETRFHGPASYEPPALLFSVPASLNALPQEPMRPQFILDGRMGQPRRR